MSALAHSLSLPGLRLIRAEILKLRKRRGLLAIVAAATIGASIVSWRSCTPRTRPTTARPAGC